MTIDVEEHFHVSNFEGVIPRSAWARHESRVHRNTELILALLAEHQTVATFFILGCVAKKHPLLVRNIVQQGHEVASHGYAHNRVFHQTPEQFRQDVRRTKRLLEDLSGVPVSGYRAASFSIRDSDSWAFQILAEEGHRYSSSTYPIGRRSYGSGSPLRLCDDGSIVEIPVTALKLGRIGLPAGGGGFFRLFPYSLSRQLLLRASQRGQRPCVFYFHPWEIDPDQPKVLNAPAIARFRHYTGLTTMYDRLRRIMGDFAWSRIDRIYFPYEVH